MNKLELMKKANDIRKDIITAVHALEPLFMNITSFIEKYTNQLPGRGDLYFVDGRNCMILR